ncbi:MAG TPA: hypothetical protein VFS00_25830, partial [Polyangiaceae bacterium]|nr:hypothetical protein [Polyangiaceae bacterium]
RAGHGSVGALAQDDGVTPAHPESGQGSATSPERKLRPVAAGAGGPYAAVVGGDVRDAIMKKKDKTRRSGPANAAGPAAEAGPTTFRCRRCGAPLTPALRPLPNAGPLPLNEGADALPRGFYWRPTQGATIWQGAGPVAFVVNRLDVTGLGATGDRTGCCGPMGMGGANLACPGGHPVATEVADCCTPHMVLLGSEAVPCETVVGAEGQGARVLVVGAGGTALTEEAFAAWAHGALGAADWHGTDVGALVREWLGRTGDDETACIVWLSSEASAHAGAPLAAIAASIEDAQKGTARRRLAITFA